MCHRSSPTARESQDALLLTRYFSSVLPKPPRAPGEPGYPRAVQRHPKPSPDPDTGST